MFEDRETPENSILCYIGISGCIGDVPFTAHVANACGHACFKSCKFCFHMGQTKNDLNEALGMVRLGGYGPNTATTAQPFNHAGQWSDVPVCYTAAGDTFNEQLAAGLKVTPELHAMRVQLAADERAKARTDHPPPVRPENSPMGSDSFETWQSGAPRCLQCGSCCLLVRLRRDQFALDRVPAMLLLGSRVMQFGHCSAGGWAAFQARLKALETLKEIGTRGASVFERVPGYQCAVDLCGMWISHEMCDGIV